MSVSSWRSLSPAPRRIALRSHCRPKTSSRPPTTRRSPASGIAVTAGPSSATTPASDASPTATPVRAERQSRLVPAASTIVSASTASTAQARKTDTNKNSVPIALTHLLPRNPRPLHSVVPVGESDTPVISVVTVGDDEDQHAAAAELRRRLTARGFATVVVDAVAVLPVLTRGLTRAASADRHMARALTRSPVPDGAATVATHPLAARVLGWMRRTGHLPIPLATYIGQLCVDRSWLIPGIDLHLTL